MITQDPVERHKILASLAGSLEAALRANPYGLTADALLTQVARKKDVPLEYVGMALSQVDCAERDDGLIRLTT